MAVPATRSRWVRLLVSDLPKPPTSPAKDPADYPGFRGLVSRWVWRIVFQRLTLAGRWVMFLTLAAISYSGASLQLQGHVIALYALAVWVVAAVGMVVARPRVTVSVRTPGRVAVGEVLPVEVEIRGVPGRSFRGGRVGTRLEGLYVVPHELSRALDCEPEDGVRVPPGPDGKPAAEATVRLGLRCARRGRHVLRGVRVESDFPFGLLRSRRTTIVNERILVYPRFTPLTRLDVPTGRRYQPGGVALASELGESFEYLGNREYRDGDNPRDIDWRATARIGALAAAAASGPPGGGGTGPVVREWVEEYMLRVAVVLDTHMPRPPAVARRDVPALQEAFEHAISLSAAVSDFMARQDCIVDLFAAGPTVYHLTAGRSLACLDEILDILACVEQTPEPPFVEIAPAIGELAERISTVVLVALDFDEARRAFVQGLLERGVAVKLIVVRPTGMPCTLDPVVMSGAVSVAVVDAASEGGQAL